MRWRVFNNLCFSDWSQNSSLLPLLLFQAARASKQSGSKSFPSLFSCTFPQKKLSYVLYKRWSWLPLEVGLHLSGAFGRNASVRPRLAMAPRLSIRIDISILLSDLSNSTKSNTNNETAMLSTQFGPRSVRPNFLFTLARLLNGFSDILKWSSKSFDFLPIPPKFYLLSYLTVSKYLLSPIKKISLMITNWM